jgi:hypothetical protein
MGTDDANPPDAYDGRQLGSIIMSLCREVGARGRMAAAFVTLHITSYAESFSAAGLWALVRLLSRVAVAVNPQAARS